MKLLFKSACAAFVLTVIFSMLPFQAACADIPGEVFRLHILANSDSESDQALKLKVRDRVLSFTEELYRGAASKEEAEELTAAKLQAIADVAADEVRKNGCDYPVKAELTNMSFTTRHYGSFTLPAGSYDALRLTIGEGEGHNWWCVMFPSLCVSGSPDARAKEVFSDGEYDVVKNEKREYRFFVVELFVYIFSFF